MKPGSRFACEDTARWSLLVPSALITLLLTAQIMEYFLASITSIVGGSETNQAANLLSTIIKLGLSFSAMILVATSMAPSHKSAVFRGACFFFLSLRRVDCDDGLG